jgi:gentisate 1,2-dioxygenase
MPAAHEAIEEAVLFSMSDRPTQQALGLWREEVPAT